MGWEVVFWNQTLFNLEKLGYKEIKLEGKARAKTDLYKRAKIDAELDIFSKRYGDQVYQTYKFGSSRKGFKKKIKNELVSALIQNYRGEKGLKKLRTKLKTSERKSSFYKSCKDLLEKEKPDFVFCTNQRPVNAIAPLTAAQDLGISTGTFIFSWDNLPKATMVVESDHYFVWSEIMKKELCSYYPFIKEKQVDITGSPQFEPHYNVQLRVSREKFYDDHNLDQSKDYICFSGDDVTTSPDDPQYLNDVAAAVKKINKNRKKKLGVIFRKCPVDISTRYDEVLQKFDDLIIPIAPNWKQMDSNWNTVLPTKEDLTLQINTIFHTLAVVNLGSSMVFDFAAFNKPCFFLNYDVEEKTDGNWSTEKIYDFVHFRTMPTGREVIWLNSKEEIGKKLNTELTDASEAAGLANEWFKKINQYPPERASQRIWEAIERIKRITK